MQAAYHALWGPMRVCKPLPPRTWVIRGLVMKFNRGRGYNQKRVDTHWKSWTAARFRPLYDVVQLHFVFVGWSGWRSKEGEHAAVLAFISDHHRGTVGRKHTNLASGLVGCNPRIDQSARVFVGTIPIQNKRILTLIALKAAPRPVPLSLTKMTQQPLWSTPTKAARSSSE